MSIEFEFTPTGRVRTIYKDERQRVYHELGKLSVHRASNVEWERSKDGRDYGWTVRAAHNPKLAIRAIISGGRYKRVVSEEGELLYFNSREAALETEVEHFWELLPPEQAKKRCQNEEHRWAHHGSRQDYCLDCEATKGL